jgi:hypothetical protein
VIHLLFGNSPPSGSLTSWASPLQATEDL